MSICKLCRIVHQRDPVPGCHLQHKREVEPSGITPGAMPTADCAGGDAQSDPQSGKRGGAAPGFGPRLDLACAGVDGRSHKLVAEHKHFTRLGTQPDLDRHKDSCKCKAACELWSWAVLCWCWKEQSAGRTGSGRPAGQRQRMKIGSVPTGACADSDCPSLMMPSAGSVLM